MDAMVSRRALLGGAGLTALAAASPSRAAERMVYVTPSGFVLGNIDVMYGEAAGHFAAQGIDIEVLPGRGTVMAVQQVLSGQALVSRTGGIDMIRAVANEGADLVAFGTSHDGDVYRIISAPAAPVRAATDLKGRVVGIASQGGSTEMLLDMMLVSAGIEPRAVERQVVGFAAGAYGLVEAGRIACFMGSSSTVMQLRLSGKEPVVLSTDEVAPAPAQVFVARRDAVEGQADLLARFLRAVKASIDDLRARPLAEVLKRIDGYDYPERRTPELLEPVARHTIDILAPAQAARLANNTRTWEACVALMQRTGLIKDATPRFQTNAVVTRAFG